MKSIWMLLPATLLATACASMMNVGDKPDDIPPRLVRNGDGRIGWDRPSAFGPVPAAVAAKGAAVCSSLDSAGVHYRALGYHPQALDLQGKPFADGGFYCVPR